jgi:dienelactone hydrolase
VAIPGFDDFVFADGDISHTVYRKGSGRAVVLMHELPGMVPQCITLAEAIAAQGFTVYMPLMFGRPGETAPLKFTLQLCISREFRMFSIGGKSPIVDWMRALASKAHTECGGPGVGAIGMCLTGNFVISLMADETVIAPVASQPSLPLGFSDEKKRHIGVPADDVAAAQKRGGPIMGVCFSGDPFCPPTRFDAIRAAFGKNFREIVIDSSPGNPHGIGKMAHAVLTRDFVDKEGHPTRQARDAVFAFLKERLAG